ncbi:MAG: Uma2 family endonuclease [Planctomycetaceae bacterium]|nr:Uma2 family endonuclease [Planctomycetaceae bacterium]
MLDGPLMTAEQFLENRFSLPESGQWAELHSGSVILFQPPDLDYGNTVLNLSKIFARYVQEHRHGYPCFDLGLLMEKSPDTIRYPAASYFLSGDRFAELDNAVTETVPDFVIELASTADRRQQMPRRIEDYLAWGTKAVWIIDPAQQCLNVIDNQGNQQLFEPDQQLAQLDLLPGLQVQIEELFVEPSWWNAT